MDRLDRKCLKCGRSFRYPSGLRKHNRRKTPCGTLPISPPDGINIKQCCQCGRTFSTVGTLQRHKRINCRASQAQINAAQLTAQSIKLAALEVKLERLTLSRTVQQHSTQIGQQINGNVTIVQNLVCFNDSPPDKVQISSELLSHASRGLTPNDRVDALALGLIRAEMQNAERPQNATAYAVSDRSTKAQFLRRETAEATEATWKSQGEWMAKQDVGRWIQQRLVAADMKGHTEEHKALVVSAVNNWPQHHQRLTSGTRVMSMLAETRDWMLSNCADRLTPELKQDEKAAEAERRENRHRSFEELDGGNITSATVWELAAKYDDDDYDSQTVKGFKLLRKVYAAMFGGCDRYTALMHTNGGKRCLSREGTGAGKSNTTTGLRQ